MHAGRRLCLPHFPEEKDQRRRDETEQAKEPKVMRVSHQERLLPENAVENLRRLVSRAPGTLVRRDPGLNGRQPLL